MFVKVLLLDFRIHWVSDEFEYVLKQTEVHKAIPFNFNTEFTRMYFGKERQRPVTYAEFTQLIFVSAP